MQNKDFSAKRRGKEGGREVTEAYLPLSPFLKGSYAYNEDD